MLIEVRIKEEGEELSMQAASNNDKAKEFSLNKSEMEYEWHY